MRRLAIAVLLVLSALAPAAMAGKNEPQPCWRLGYDLSLSGRKTIKVGPYCVPCLRYCDLLPVQSAVSRPGL